MSVPFLGRAEVEALLEPDALIEAVAAALVEVSAGRVSLPPRVAAFTDAGLLGVMPAHVPALDALTAKLVTVFPQNRDRPTHQAIIALFDPRNGSLLLLLDGTAITAQRTAAASALAARLLARDDAQLLAIVGTGVQALSHARYLPRARKFREILIAGRDRAKAEELAAQFPGARAAGIEEAVRAADVICAVTDAHEPVVRRQWLRPRSRRGRRAGRAALRRAGGKDFARADHLVQIGGHRRGGRRRRRAGLRAREGARPYHPPVTPLRLYSDFV